MRGELLGLVKSTSAFKDLGLSSHTTYWSPCPLCLVQARRTLSELDKILVHPDVRKETDNCQEKGNRCPQRDGFCSDRMSVCPRGGKSVHVSQKTSRSPSTLPPCFRTPSPPQVSYPSHLPKYRSPCHISKQFRTFRKTVHSRWTLAYYRGMEMLGKLSPKNCILIHAVLEQKKGYQVTEMKSKTTVKGGKCKLGAWSPRRY